MNAFEEQDEGYGGTKMSFQQKAVMLEFMEDHPDFAKNKLLGNDGKRNRKAMWEILSTQLNGVKGAKKTSEKWQRVWIDLKNKVKKKASTIKQGMSQTGGGPPLKVILTEIEEKVLNIIGKTAVYGLQSTQDAPLDSEDVNQQLKIIVDLKQPSTSSELTSPLSSDINVMSPIFSDNDALEDHDYYSIPRINKKRKLSLRSPSSSGASETATSADEGHTTRRRRVGPPMSVASLAGKFADIGETLNKRMESIDSKLDLLIIERQKTNSILISLVAAVENLKKYNSISLRRTISG